MAYPRQDITTCAGLRRHKFTVYEETRVPDELGGGGITWTPVYSGYGALIWNDSFETIETRQANLQESYAQWDILYNPRLKSEHVIVFQTRQQLIVFAIEGIRQQSLEKRRVIVETRVRKDLDTHNFAGLS
jgi:hypothetical protein